MNINKPNFFFQWHITDKCQQRCQGCYLFQSDVCQEKENKDLDLSTLLLIAEDAIKTARALKANPIFVLTGGDPILYQNFWGLLEAINNFSLKFKTKIKIDLLGNPFEINDKVASRMVNLGVIKYQLSIDGLREKHDFLRKPESYKKTLRAAEILKRHGIRTSCMFTLSKFNSTDLVKVMRKVAQKGFDAFAFARFCKPEKMSVIEYKKDIFSPFEYKKFLGKIYQATQEISSSYPNIRFVFKDHLWKLFFYEKGDIKNNDLEKIRVRKIVAGGCSLGIATLSILSDGTVYACRRFKSPIGKVPEQKLLDIFLNSKEINYYRNPEKYEKCKNCPLVCLCRGCGAVSYGISGSFFSPDPQCWYNEKR